MDGLADSLRRFFEGAGLPLSANIVLPGIGREKEIGFAIVRADPLAIQSDAHRWGGYKINKEIDQGFAVFGLADGMLRIVGLTSNSTELGPQPAAVRAAAAWSWAMAGEVTAKSDKRRTQNCSRMRASMIEAHLSRHTSTQALPLVNQPPEECNRLLGFSLNLRSGNKTCSLPARFRG